MFIYQKGERIFCGAISGIKLDWLVIFCVLGDMEHLTVLKILMHIDQIIVRLIYKLLEVFIYQKGETERTRKKRPWPTFPRHCFSLSKWSKLWESEKCFQMLKVSVLDRTAILWGKPNQKLAV